MTKPRRRRPPRLRYDMVQTFLTALERFGRFATDSDRTDAYGQLEAVLQHVSQGGVLEPISHFELRDMPGELPTYVRAGEAPKPRCDTPAVTPNPDGGVVFETAGRDATPAPKDTKPAATPDPRQTSLPFGRDAMPVEQWEYRMEHAFPFGSGAEALEVANRLGREGWEMFGPGWFKRRLP